MLLMICSYTYTRTKMKHLKVPEMLTKFIYSMLQEMLIDLDLHDGTRLLRVVRKGLTQGLVLSPLLERSLNNIQILQYADDLLLVY